MMFLFFFCLRGAVQAHVHNRENVTVVFTWLLFLQSFLERHWRRSQTKQGHHTAGHHRTKLKTTGRTGYVWHTKVCSVCPVIATTTSGSCLRSNNDGISTWFQDVEKRNGAQQITFQPITTLTLIWLKKKNKSVKSIKKKSR